MWEIKQVFCYHSVIEHHMGCPGQYYNSRKVNTRHTNLKRSHKIVAIYIEHSRQS